MGQGEREAHQEGDENLGGVGEGLVPEQFLAGGLGGRGKSLMLAMAGELLGFDSSGSSKESRALDLLDKVEGKEKAGGHANTRRRRDLTLGHGEIRREESGRVS